MTLGNDSFMIKVMYKSSIDLYSHKYCSFQAKRMGKRKCIGMLDIYGFEVLEVRLPFLIQECIEKQSVSSDYSKYSARMIQIFQAFFKVIKLIVKVFFIKNNNMKACLGI